MSMLLMRQIASADVPTPVANTKTLFLDTDGIPKFKDSSGNLLPIQASLSDQDPLMLGGPSPGTAALAARYDHRHPHGAQPGGTNHAEATTSVAGFMSAADKVKLDALPGAAVADESSYTGIDNAQVGAVYAQVSELEALRVKFNSLLAALRAAGVIET